MTRKEQIIDKAIELFAAEGFENTSIQKLAAHAGVAQGLLYRHFKNKNDLLLSLIILGLQQVADTLQPYTDQALSFKEAFKEHLALSFQYLRSHTQLWRVLHATRQNEKLMNELGLLADAEKNIVKPIAAKMKSAGYSQPEMHAWLLFSLIDGITALYLVHPETYPLTKMERFLINKIDAYEK